VNVINIIGKLPRSGNQGSHAVAGITHIVVHHDAQFRPDAYDDETRYVQQANFHIGRGEDGLQYNYKISNLGDIYLCRNWTDILWHCGNYAVNCASIAICLDGNMESQVPTSQQIQALQDLLDNLTTEHPEFPASQGNVWYHNEVALPGGATACCGRNLKPAIVEYRADGDIVNDVPAAPVIPQVPVTNKYYRVFDYNGTQVGAYTTLQNAMTKLDSIEAGVIKDPDMNEVKRKDKVPTTLPGPFVGVDAPPEVKPTEPPVLPEIPVEPPIPTEPPITPPEPALSVWATLWKALTELWNTLFKR